MARPSTRSAVGSSTWPQAQGAGGPRLFLRDVPTVCAVSTQRREAGGTRHVCAFPSQDVRLFAQLHVLVLDAATNQTRHQRELSVDVVGESLPWHNTRAPGPSLQLGPFQGLAAPCASAGPGVPVQEGNATARSLQVSSAPR